MEFAEEMLELTKRFKAARAPSDPQALRPSHVAGHAANLDNIVAGLRNLRQKLGEQVRDDSSTLAMLRGRETNLVSEVESLMTRRKGHLMERKSTGDALAQSAEEQASIIKTASSSAKSGAYNFTRTSGRASNGALASMRGYTMSLSHRVDLSCTGTLPGNARPTRPTTVFPTLTRTAPGCAGPTFSPMRPKGGTARKAGDLTVVSSKGGGAVEVSSAASQGSRITIQEEAEKLGYRRPEDRAYATATAAARKMSINRDSTNI